MPESKGEYYLHFVWTTQQRHPLLTPAVERSIQHCLQSEALRLRCNVLAIGGMPDHVHLALKAPTALSPAQIMKQLKGVSSKFAAGELVRANDALLTWFRWQEGYGVFRSARLKKTVLSNIFTTRSATILTANFGLSVKINRPLLPLLLPSSGRSPKAPRRVIYCPKLGARFASDLYDKPLL